MKVKDPIQFVGGIDQARQLVLSMHKYIQENGRLKNCWFSYSGSRRFITPYAQYRSVSFKHLKAALVDIDKMINLSIDN